MFCCAFAFAQSSNDENEVKKLNAQFDEAIKNADVAFYERVLAPDYISYSNDGSTKNKTKVLEEVRKHKANPTYRINNVDSEDVNVKISGNLAVVSAKWNMTSNSIEEDEPHNDTGHYLAVYEKKNGQWQIVSEMGSEKPHTPEELEPALKKVSEKYDKALRARDKEAFEKLLAEDYSSTNNEGKIRTREQDIAMMFDPELKLDKMSTTDKKFKIHKNVAVETGQYDVKGSYKGEEFSETGRYTSTWIYKDGKWQIVADHTSTIQSEK